jgi:hypothetical protein
MAFSTLLSQINFLDLSFPTLKEKEKAGKFMSKFLYKSVS